MAVEMVRDGDEDKLLGDYLMDLLHERYTEPVADNINAVMVGFVFSRIPFPWYLKWVSAAGGFLVGLLDKYTPEVPLEAMEKLLDLLGVPYTSGRRREWPGD